MTSRNHHGFGPPSVTMTANSHRVTEIDHSNKNLNQSCCDQLLTDWSQSLEQYHEFEAENQNVWAQRGRQEVLMTDFSIGLARGKKPIKPSHRMYVWIASSILPPPPPTTTLYGVYLFYTKLNNFNCILLAKIYKLSVLRGSWSDWILHRVFLLRILKQSRELGRSDGLLGSSFGIEQGDTGGSMPSFRTCSLSDSVRDVLYRPHIWTSYEYLLLILESLWSRVPRYKTGIIAPPPNV